MSLVPHTDPPLCVSFLIPLSPCVSEHFPFKSCTVPVSFYPSRYFSPRAYRVVDALAGGIGVGVGGVAYDVAADDGLVDIEHEADHHLNHHRHEQVTVNSRPVVLEAPVGGGRS